MKFSIVTIFPHIFDSFLNESLIKRARDKKIIQFNILNLRDFSSDKHKTVDAAPYGGGPGMVMKVEPFYQALEKIKRNQNKAIQRKIVLLAPSGKQFNQKTAKKFSKLDELVLLCGRYEGVDARVEKFIDEKISIGPYVLNGGEVAAMVVVEAVCRLIPGFLGNIKSLDEETFSFAAGKKSEYPQYTRPEVFQVKGKKYKVPSVLLSGDHKKIKQWREKRKKR